MGDFGGVIAQPGPRVQADPQAYGAGVGRAIEQAGNVAMNDAGREIAQENAEAKHAADQAKAEADRAKRQAEADAKQLAREQAAEAKAAARESARVKALTASATVTNGLNDLHDEISTGLADGTVDKSKAVELFTGKAKKLQDSALEGVDPENRALVEATLLDNAGRVRRSVSGLVVAKDKADIMSGGLAYFEEMQRFAGRGPKEADQAIANVRTFWTATGPMAGEKDPQARVQKFAEGVRFNQATSLVNADPGAALKALKDPKYLPELDPGARTNLIHTADSRVTQAANRAEIANNAAQRRLDTQWKAVSTVFDAGKVLDPASAEAQRKAFKGTPYAAAFESMMAAGPATTAFASQPLAVQSQSLMAFQATMNTKGATPEQIAEYKKRETAYNAALADYAKDPYQAAAERGVIVGVSPLSLDMQQLPGQLAERARDAQKVSIAAGTEVSLFRPGEADKVGDILKAMPPKDRAGALKGLAMAMTPGQIEAFAKQVDPKDQAMGLAMRYAGKQTQVQTTFMGRNVGAPVDGRLVSESILRGQQARATGTSTKGLKQPDVTPGKWEAEFAAALVDLYPNQQFADQVREAAMLISHDISAEKGGGLTSDDRALALRMAVGGDIIEHNGRRIPLPAGVDADRLDKRLRTVTPAEIKSDTVRAGGVQMPAAEFLKTLPGLPLMPYRSGQFTPLVGGRPVVGADNKPILIEVR
jgi:hypothetical protein